MGVCPFIQGNSKVPKLFSYCSNKISIDIIENINQKGLTLHLLYCTLERLLLTDEKTPGFFTSRGEEFNLGLETRLDHSELLCNKVLLKYKGDRESF